MSRHVSAETLARHREGTLSARKAASIDAHLSGCARCAGTNTDLAAVSNLLASTQLPPVPDSLAQRIQMAIANESAERATRNAALGVGTQAADAAELADAPGASRAAVPGAEAETTHIPGQQDLPARTGRRRIALRLRMPRLSSPLVLRGLAAAAAVVIVAGAGFLLANGQTATESTAGSTGSQGGGNRAAAPSRALANGPASLSHRVSLRYRLNGKIVTTTALSSSTNFRRNSLARQVRKDVSSAQSIGPTGTSQPTGSAEATESKVSVTRLEGCLSRLDAGRRVLVVNIAHFLGKPASIIVLRSLKSADLLDIAIVGLSCSASHADVIYRTTIPAS